jgi:hypothetical protein
VPSSGSEYFKGERRPGVAWQKEALTVIFPRPLLGVALFTWTTQVGEGWLNLVGLLPEGATFCEPCLSTRRLAQNGGTSYAQNHSLSMAEHGCNLVAAWALDIHEVGVGALHKTLLLVLALLRLKAGVDQIAGELQNFDKEEKNTMKIPGEKLRIPGKLLPTDAPSSVVTMTS